MLTFINTSKTMVREPRQTGLGSPVLLPEAKILAGLVARQSPTQLRRLMHISYDLAVKTHGLMEGWTAEGPEHVAALDAFQGDIYRGLRAGTFSEADRAEADRTLRILSGLYGLIRPLDGIEPYRLELMYGLKGRGFANLYEFWGRKIVDQLPGREQLVNLASAEYWRLVGSYIEPSLIVEPQFLTRKAAGDAPEFVAVHAKAARGAMARWIVLGRVERADDLRSFDDLGYAHDAGLSQPGRPVFVRTGVLSLIALREEA